MTWPPTWFKLWIWLIAKANHAENKVAGKTFNRGEVFTSYDEMREIASYKVGWRKIRPTKTHIGDFCEILRKTTMITTRKTTRGLFIRLEKYEEYQTPRNYENYNESEYRKLQTPSTINKNVKNEQEIATANEVLKPLTQSELWEIAKRYSVAYSDVKDEQEALFNWMEDGHKNEVKSIRARLMNWVLRKKKEGRIETLTALEMASQANMYDPVTREKNRLAVEEGEKHGLDFSRLRK